MRYLSLRSSKSSYIFFPLRACKILFLFYSFLKVIMVLFYQPRVPPKPVIIQSGWRMRNIIFISVYTFCTCAVDTLLVFACAISNFFVIRMRSWYICKRWVRIGYIHGTHMPNRCKSDTRTRIYFRSIQKQLHQHESHFLMFRSKWPSLNGVSAGSLSRNPSTASNHEAEATNAT